MIIPFNHHTKMVVFSLILQTLFLITEAVNNRIVGGVPIEIEEAPYQVFLDVQNDFYKDLCGGTILNNKVIITAAHCVISHSELKVRVGSKYKYKGGKVYSVSKIITHEHFHQPSCDIALLFLSEALEFSKSVAPVQLPSSDDVIEDGTMSIVTGWGQLQENGSFPSVLQKVSVPIVNQKTCIDAYGGNKLGDDIICAGYMGLGGRDACEGDSGGPLVVDGKLIGIVSWGEGCARPDFPGVYTRVTEFRKWIDEKIINFN